MSGSRRSSADISHWHDVRGVLATAAQRAEWGTFEKTDKILADGGGSGARSSATKRWEARTCASSSVVSP
jgi:hypothetical protein